MSTLMDAVNGAKEIADLVKKYNDIPLMEKIVALQTQIMAQTAELLSVTNENRRLDEELSKKKAVSFANPYYYEDGNEVPLCPKCYSSSQEKLRNYLTHPPQDYVGGHGRTCRVCREFYREGPRQKQIEFAIPRGRDSWMG